MYMYTEHVHVQCTCTYTLYTLHLQTTQFVHIKFAGEGVFVSGDDQAMEPAASANFDAPSDVRHDGRDDLSELVHWYIHAFRIT